MLFWLKWEPPPDGQRLHDVMRFQSSQAGVPHLGFCAAVACLEEVQHAALDMRPERRPIDRPSDLGERSRLPVRSAVVFHAQVLGARLTSAASQE